MNATVYNLTKKCYVKRHQAVRRESDCEIEFVNNDEFRELERHERLTKMQTRQRVIEVLPPIEPNGCKFVPPLTSKTPASEISRLVREARQFYEHPYQVLSIPQFEHFPSLEKR